MKQPNQSQKVVAVSTEIIGASAATQDLRAQISRAAPFSSSVLVTGPSGSGKELVARSLHAQSARAEELFIPVDCASLSGELMASQLFGHVEGAFTGANYAALGCFRAADRGTIFLDEIGELELPLQAKLLRTLQERVVTPVGSHEGVPVDARVVAATNRNLQQEVAAGRFREDLYYRLNVISVRTLPLCARPDDVVELARCFLDKMAEQGLPHCTLSPGSLELLQDCAWPGNVRQLKNVLEQAVINSDAELLTLSFMQQLLTQAAGYEGACSYEEGANPPAFEASTVSRGDVIPRPHTDDQWLSLATVERDYVVYTLEHTYYNQSAAARLLGISRQALIRLMKKMEIQAPRANGKTSRGG